MPEYLLSYLFSEGAPAPWAEAPGVSIAAESLSAAKAAAEEMARHAGGLFHRVQEAVLSDPANPSLEYSRWMRGLGWIDNPDAGTPT